MRCCNNYRCYNDCNCGGCSRGCYQHNNCCRTNCCGGYYGNNCGCGWNNSFITPLMFWMIRDMTRCCRCNWVDRYDRYRC